MTSVLNQKQSLAEQAYEKIEEMIVTHKLKPGMVFTEADLIKRLDVGRTPVREALMRLAGQGLVVTIPRRGMMVTEINITNHLSLLETRRTLERLIAIRAARRANEEQRSALREYAGLMQKAAQANDLQEYMRIDHEFTQVMEEASGNPSAVNANSTLHVHCRRFWYHYHISEDLNYNARLHVQLMLAIVDSDEEGAAKAVDELLDYLVEFSANAVLKP